MKKRFAGLAVVLLLLGGCSVLDVQEVGNKTTTYYDQSGVKTHDVSEGIMLGDKSTEYYKAAGKIADASERVETTRIKGILTATAPKEGDSEAVVAWKSAAATLSITQVGGNSAKAIQSLYYGKDRYDNAGEIIGVGGSVVTSGIYTYGFKKVMDKAFEAAGDRNSIQVDGDKNTVSVEKQELRNEIHAQTTGDGSSPVVNVDSSNKTPVQSGSSGTTDGADSDLSELIEGYKEDGLTTGETNVLLQNEHGYTTSDIVGGEIIVDGTNYGGW